MNWSYLRVTLGEQTKETWLCKRLASGCSRVLEVATFRARVSLFRTPTETVRSFRGALLSDNAIAILKDITVPHG